MSDIGTLIDYPQQTIDVLSLNSIAVEMNAQDTHPTVTGNTWPSSNLAIYIPFRIGYITTFQKMFWFNSTTVGNNDVDVGIYDSQQNQLVHTGSTLTSGSAVLQGVSITSTTLYPGLYYMAMSVNGTTDTFEGGNNSGNALNIRVAGVYNQSSAFALPSTATFAGATNAFYPFMGLSGSSIV